jgi:hypothetical protein
MSYFTKSEITQIYRLKGPAKNFWYSAIYPHVDFGHLKPDSIIIAGGCFTSFLHDEKPKDIDIFVLDNLEAIKTAMKHLHDGDHIVNDEQHYDKSASKLNTNIVNVVNRKVDGVKYQWIFTRYKTRQELIKHFDFVHTKVSYDPITDKLYLSPETYHAIMNKELIKNGNNIIAIWRYDKFDRKGWKIPANVETSEKTLETFGNMVPA